ncbi:MAG: hypothetical protein WBI17_02380 [Clostridiaceae bacterium]
MSTLKDAYIDDLILNNFSWCHEMAIVNETPKKTRLTSPEEVFIHLDQSPTTPLQFSRCWRSYSDSYSPCPTWETAGTMSLRSASTAIQRDPRGD